MGWAISLRPSAAEVLAALREGILLDAAERPALGGVPERLRIDNGLEFCAEAVRAATLALDVEFSQAASYTPEEKGKIERLHLTCVQTLLSGLPHYTGGRRGANGRLLDPRAPLRLEQFVCVFADWVCDYNRSSHSEPGGLSPVEAFIADPTPLRSVSVEDARALLAWRKTARVRRYGITHDKHRYTAVELHELVGEEVQIAFAPHDQRSIEVYWRGSSVCTAYPQDALTVAQQQEIVAERRAYAAELRRRQRRAARQGRSRLAPLTVSEPTPAEATVFVENALTGARRRPRDEMLRANARVDLLAPAGPPRARRDG